jgi:hypothetical protein
MGGNIVKLLITRIGNGLCAFGLSCSNGADGGKERGIDCSSIVYKGTYNVLDLI